MLWSIPPISSSDSEARNTESKARAERFFTPGGKAFELIEADNCCDGIRSSRSKDVAEISTATITSACPLTRSLDTISASRPYSSIALAVAVRLSRARMRFNSMISSSSCKALSES